MNEAKQIELMDQIFDITDKIRKIMEQKITPEDSPDITPLQLSALRFLYKNPKSTVGLLGEHLYLSSSAVAQLTDRLASAEYIKRENDPKDRRVVLLSLTESGKGMLSKIQHYKRKRMKEVLQYMSEKDLEKMVHILSNLLKNIE